MSVTDWQELTALVVNGTSAPASVTVPESGAAAWASCSCRLVHERHRRQLSARARQSLHRQAARLQGPVLQLAAGAARPALRPGGVTVLDKDLAQATAISRTGRPVVAEAVRVLRAAVPSVKRVALAGHSEGGPVSLVLITTDRETKIDAYISLSAPALRMFDLMRQQTRCRSRTGWPPSGR